MNQPTREHARVSKMQTICSATVAWVTRRSETASNSGVGELLQENRKESELVRLTSSL